MRLLFWVMLGATAWAASACDRPDAQAKSAPRRVIDSIIPRDEALRRFQAKLAPVGILEGGKGSRDSLVVAFVDALATSDTATLAAMAVSPAEFGYLYYPTTPRSRPPYNLAPDLMWFLLEEHNDRGLRKALQFYGGQDLTLLGYECDPKASVEGENTVWGPCQVRFRRAEGDTVSQRLFSQIIARGGRFKFLSYANKLN